MSFEEPSIGSERLTPVDILNIHFPRRLRGYAVAEVDEFVRRVAADMEAVLAEVAQLRDRVTVLERELAQYRTMETNMRDALVLAQKAAEETRTAAQAQAQARLQEADARLAEVNAQIERLHQERRRLAREFQARLRAQLDWVAEELAAIPSSREEMEGGTGTGEAVVGTGEVRTILHGTQDHTAYSLKNRADHPTREVPASELVVTAEETVSPPRSGGIGPSFHG